MEARIRTTPGRLAEAVSVRRFWYIIRWPLLLTLGGIWTGFLLAILFPQR